eukprot:799102-Pleurochrysis_carterae.AAC.1
MATRLRALQKLYKMIDAYLTTQPNALSSKCWPCVWSQVDLQVAGFIASGIACSMLYLEASEVRGLERSR